MNDMKLKVLFVFTVILESPDTVLIERAQGKRIDPTTGGGLDVCTN